MLISTHSTAEEERLGCILSPCPTPSSTVLGFSSPRFEKLAIGTRIEVSPLAFKIARRVGELVGEGGAALIMDYGGEKVFGDSFRVSCKFFIFCVCVCVTILFSVGFQRP